MCEKYIFLLSLNPETDFMKRLLLLVAATLCSLFSFAQLLTWTPAFPKETDPITITVDATKGNQG